MSFLFRWGATALIVVWTIICVLAYILVEVLGEAFIDQASVVLGGTLASVLGFLHDIGMVALVLVWVVVSWLVWTLGKSFGGGRARVRY